MKIFTRYPRLAMREKKVIYSENELLDTIQQGAKNGKVCLMSLYSFQEVYNKGVNPETAVIDCALWEGPIEFCESKCNQFPKYPSIIIFDGKDYMAIVFKEFTLEQLKTLNACTELDKLILVPGCQNLRTGNKCTIVRKNGC